MNKKNVVTGRKEKHSDLVAELSVHMSNMYALGLRFQNFHWHVTGPRFKSLHDMFEESFMLVRDEIDDLAERIRMLGAHVPATLNALHELSEISDRYQPMYEDGMLEESITACVVVQERCSRALKVAGAYGDEVTVDMLVQHLKILEKSIWKFRSSLSRSSKVEPETIVEAQKLNGAGKVLEAH